MKSENDFTKIQVLFYNKLTTIDLTESFYLLNEEEVGLVEKVTRHLDIQKLNLADYVHLINNVKRAIEMSEQLSIQFFNRNKENIEPLYSMELAYFDVDFDLISYKMFEKESQQLIFKFCISVECMDKFDQPIFMYDGRGSCYINFELNSLDELKVIDVT